MGQKTTVKETRCCLWMHLAPSCVSGMRRGITFSELKITVHGKVCEIQNVQLSYVKLLLLHNISSSNVFASVILQNSAEMISRMELTCVTAGISRAAPSLCLYILLSMKKYCMNYSQTRFRLTTGKDDIGNAWLRQDGYTEKIQRTRLQSPQNKTCTSKTWYQTFSHLFLSVVEVS